MNAHEARQIADFSRTVRGRISEKARSGKYSSTEYAEWNSDTRKLILDLRNDSYKIRVESRPDYCCEMGNCDHSLDETTLQEHSEIYIHIEWY
jgi:hypothetical protein